MNLFRALLGKNNFSHGIHPPEHKAETCHAPIKRLPFPPKLIIPLSQHIGKPSLPLVGKGAEVARGQPLAQADGPMSVPLHAPATGRIVDIDLHPSTQGGRSLAMVLEPYEAATQEVLWREPSADLGQDRETLLAAVKNAGLVGLGGAAFPTHIKLSVPPDKHVEYLVVNGCECEPYLSCDHRVMLEQAQDLILGIRYALAITGVSKAIIGIEDNKMDAVYHLRRVLGKDEQISVEAVATKYPQGSEKMLIKSLLGREVPAGKIPADIGVVVNNVGTLAALGHLLPRGEALIERVITVTGAGVKRPGNYLVPLGTPIGFILDQVGYQASHGKFILGGPMMGASVSSLETPISKGTSGVLALHEDPLDEPGHRIWPCIKCGRCVSACPMHLNPAWLGQLAQGGQYQLMADRYNLKQCFECGSCSYVCPSRIPLVQHFRIAKSILRDKAAA